MLFIHKAEKTAESKLTQTIIREPETFLIQSAEPELNIHHHLILFVDLIRFECVILKPFHVFPM
jgi:hypothetical protein